MHLGWRRGLFAARFHQISETITRHRFLTVISINNGRLIVPQQSQIRKRPVRRPLHDPKGDRAASSMVAAQRDRHRFTAQDAALLRVSLRRGRHCQRNVRLDRGGQKEQRNLGGESALDARLHRAANVP
ncbi:MAG: hypothetical protein ABI016_15595 [Chthoniobacterales bacterium]